MISLDPSAGTWLRNPSIIAAAVVVAAAGLFYAWRRRCRTTACDPESVNDHPTGASHKCRRPQSHPRTDRGTRRAVVLVLRGA